jgi:hypothetical protein
LYFLNTFSKAYSNNSDDYYNPGSSYNDGIRGAFSQGDFSFSASITDNVYARSDANNGDGDELGFDVQVTYSGIENLALSIGYADDGDVDAAIAAGETASATSLAVGSAAVAAADLVGTGTISNIFNISAAYSLGQLTLAGEYNDFEENSGGYAKDGDSYLLLANYAVNDDLSLTLRHAEVDLDGSSNDREKTTIAAGYNVTYNLSTVIEYSSGETGSTDNDVFAVEGTFTF